MKDLKKIINSNKIMVFTLILIMVGFIFGAIIPMFFSKEKPKPKYRNGDMVSLKLDSREGMVIDNTFKFNGKSNCWQVQVRMKETEDDKKGFAEKIMGRKANGLINGIPESYNEFELEKQ